MSSLPSGTVTFLFTDIVDSTLLWEQQPEAMKSALAQHDAILRQEIEAHSGQVFKSTGDGAHAVFSTAIDAVKAAVAAQKRFKAPLGDLPIKIRVGLHTGEAELRQGDYFGQALNRAARITTAAHGGQILLSEITAQVVREHAPPGTSIKDLGAYRLKGFAEPEHILQLQAHGLPADFPALQASAAVVSNLPSQLTSFIGRERELVETSERLASARLLTLIGPGGTGKSRLSLQLAVHVAVMFPDGVWLVELAPVSDPSQILQRVAAIFGLRPQPGMPLEQVAENYLQAKSLLLIFDNCEHLIEACAELADRLLKACPGLKIIISSREALGIRGESVYRVPSLSVPKADEQDLEALAKFEAVQLFLERAAAANRDFTLTAKNGAAVAMICRRLDGIPLAIELAAARISALSAEQIAARLGDRFRLLTGGSRTALPRQQTLRALIDWSYDLLSAEECAMLRRLSVFAGGWTLEACEAVLPDLDVLKLLPQLVNKSLVGVEEDEDGPRYRLLESVRQYARDRLLDMGEGARTRSRHLEYFAGLAERGEDEVLGAQALKWTLRFEAEHDNFRAALEWAMEHDIDAVLRTASALGNFWFKRGYDSEGRRWIEEALRRAEASPKPEGPAERRRQERVTRAWLALSWLAFSQGDFAPAMSATDKAAELARALGDDRTLALALGFQASAMLSVGQLDSVDELIAKAHEAAQRSGDHLSLGMSSVMLGWRMTLAGRPIEQAKAKIEQGIELVKDTNSRFASLMLYFGLGMQAKFEHRFEEARAKLSQLIPLFDEMGDLHRANMIRSELAHMDREQGHYAEAASAYRETIGEWQRLGHRAAVAHQLECFAALARVAEEPERAARLYGAAEALRERINIPMTAMERAEYEKDVAALRGGMEDGLFRGLWAEGRALKMEQAVNLALQVGHE